MMEERETKELENQNIGTSSRVQSQFEVESDGNEEEEDFESITFPAISPISNVSTSSGKLINIKLVNFLSKNHF